MGEFDESQTVKKLGPKVLTLEQECRGAKGPRQSKRSEEEVWLK